MKPTGYFNWDPAKVAEALQLESRKFGNWLSNGANAAPLCQVLAENWLSTVSSITPERMTVRTVRFSGTSLGPSINYGGKRDRQATYDAYIKKFDDTDVFVFVDITTGTPAAFWAVASKQCLSWWLSGKVKENATMDYAQFRDLVRSLEEGEDLAALMNKNQ